MFRFMREVTRIRVDTRERCQHGKQMLQGLNTASPFKPPGISLRIHVQIHIYYQASPTRKSRKEVLLAFSATAVATYRGHMPSTCFIATRLFHYCAWNSLGLLGWDAPSVLTMCLFAKLA